MLYDTLFYVPFITVFVTLNVLFLVFLLHGLYVAQTKCLPEFFKANKITPNATRLIIANLRMLSIY